MPSSPYLAGIKGDVGEVPRRRGRQLGDLWPNEKLAGSGAVIS